MVHADTCTKVPVHDDQLDSTVGFEGPGSCIRLFSGPNSCENNVQTAGGKRQPAKLPAVIVTVPSSPKIAGSLVIIMIHTFKDASRCHPSQESFQLAASDRRIVQMLSRISYFFEFSVDGGTASSARRRRTRRANSAAALHLNMRTVVTIALPIW